MPPRITTGVRPQDIDDRGAAELCELVRANDRIVMMTPHIVHARLKLEHIVDEHAALGGPIHATDDATEWKSVFCIAAGELFKYREHPIPIEAAVPRGVSLLARSSNWPHCRAAAVSVPAEANRRR